MRSFKPPAGWTNVFELVPSNERLYGTETLFGDWNGRTLLLAKDGAPTHVIRHLRDRGETTPWRHAQRKLGDSGGWKTNEYLTKAVSHISGGLLYGSSTANLLYDNPSWSRSLPGFYSGPLHDYLKIVLGWVIESMSRIERILCLGQEAWFLTSHVLGQSQLARRFSEFRDRQMQVTGVYGQKRICVHALYHPAARVSNDLKAAGWHAMK